MTPGTCLTHHWVDERHERVLLALGQGAAAAEVFEGLLMLQHRGQDSAGMVTYDCARFCEHKANGLVNDVFQPRDMAALRGAGRHLLSRPPPYWPHDTVGTSRARGVGCPGG